MDELNFDPYSLVQQQIQNNNEWSAQQAQNQMDFQREMSNTAHQREVADLKAAGLNPVLSAHTQGASTPSGAMGTVDHSGTQAIVDLMSQMISADTAKTIAGYGGSGYGYGSNRNGRTGGSGNGNYNIGFGPGQIIQDLIYAITGKTPKEWVNYFGTAGKAMVQNWPNEMAKWQAEHPGLYYDQENNQILPLPTSAKKTSTTYYNKTKDRYLDEPKSYSKNSARSPSHGSAKGSGAGSGGIKFADIPGVHPGWTR